MREYRQKIVDHLVQQKGRSIIERSGVERCQYRAPDGKMCAIGCLIPDNEYEDWMDGTYATEEIMASVETLRMMQPEVQRELIRWQAYHDHAARCCHVMAEFSYQLWINGDENHHPEKFLLQVEQEFGV